MANKVSSLSENTDNTDQKDSIEQPQEGTRRTAKDTTEEIDRFCTILSSRIRIRGQFLYVELPTSQGKTKEYPLLPRKNTEDPVRAWVLEQYAELYPGVSDPRIQSYTLARSKVVRNTDTPDSEDPLQELEAPVTRRGRRSNQFAAIVQEVEKRSDFSQGARDIGVRYTRVPYSIENADFTGIWRLDPEKPYRLLDCSMRVLDLNRPHATSRSADYSGTVEVTNALGEKKTFTIDRETIEERGIDAKFKGFASWPHMPTHRHWLLEAIDLLMREKGVLIRDQREALAWAEHEALGLVWVANNGIETAQGFIPSDTAPFLAPSLLSPGNGYRALTEPQALSGDIWTLLLQELNPNNWARMYAKLGASMRVIFPEGTIERAGKLDFVIETVGEGSGQGKSAEDNYVLSLFGSDFTYNRPPLLTTDDTSPSRPRLMEIPRYCPFMTEDRKAREGNMLFIKQHETRRKLIEQYADNTGGGIKMTAYGTKMISRGNPQGVPFLTGNADHSAYAFSNETGGEEMTEWRACTFILTSDEKSDYQTSLAVNERRQELTNWGTYERQWIMQQYNADRQAFTLRVQDFYAQAEMRVLSVAPEWPHTRPMNVCVDIVSGMLARQAFMQDTFTGQAQELFFSQWIDTFTDEFIQDRLTRAQYLQSLIDRRHNDMRLEDFVLDTIRYALGTSQFYVASQQEKLLQPDDVPLSLSKMGMKLDQTVEGAEMWRPGQHGIVGYYLARKDAIAFNFNILYPLLEAASQKQKYPLPCKSQFKAQFAETGIPHVKRDEYGQIVRPDTSEWVSGKAGQYITIDLHTLYPEPETVEPNEEEELQREADNEKVVPIRRAEKEASSSRAGVNEKVPAQAGIDFSASEESIEEVTV